MKLIVNHKRGNKTAGKAANDFSRRIDEFARAAKLRVYVAYNANRVRFIGIAASAADVAGYNGQMRLTFSPSYPSRIIENLITTISIRLVVLGIAIFPSPTPRFDESKIVNV